jgi:hypothetical protein
MPKIRIGFATDLNLVNEQVGIGTTNPTARLDVRGQIRADNSAGSGGISTLTRYDGFLNKTQSLPNNVSIAQTTKGNLNSLSGEIVIDGEITVTEGTPLTGGRLDSLTVTGKFDLPHGGTEDREETPEKGSTRFNQDLGQLEFYTGLEWRTVGSYADSGGRGRVVIAGGRTPDITQKMEYVNIMTLGNTQDFGTLSGAARRQCGGLANSVRGLNAGGQGSSSNIDDIDYFTMASGGTTSDFGNLTGGAKQTPAGASSSTRGLFMGGGEAGDTPVDDIDYCEIMTTGNTPGACANSTKALIGAGSNTGQFFKSIDASIIATGGNCTNFGDLSTVGNSLAVGSSSNSTRGLFIFGTNPDSNVIEYVTFATSGNGVDFGDVSGTLGQQGCCSDSHGGLGGF